MTDANDLTEKDGLRKASYHHGDLRAGLIEATRRLVEEKGTDGFSVSDACRLAGVSTAAPYKHFKNKNEMLIAMVLEGMERLRANMATALDGIPKGSPLRAKALGKEYISFALREPGVFRLKFGGFPDGDCDDKLKAAGEQTFEIVLQEVAYCLRQEDISPDVRRRGFMLWSFVHGLSFILLDKDMTKVGGDIELDPLLEDIALRVLTD